MQLNKLFEEGERIINVLVAMYAVAYGRETAGDLKLLEKVKKENPVYFAYAMLDSVRALNGTDTSDTENATDASNTESLERLQRFEPQYFAAACKHDTNRGE
ncbi:MAG: hypothetical protein FGM57_02565 [Candidatus Taylorbacteria bacterium]|nr:hypothetical protein [Candidatus Taylorbacteria bacterium]